MVLTYQVPSKFLCHFQEKRFIEFIPVYVFRALGHSFVYKQLIHDFLKFIVTAPAYGCFCKKEKTVKNTFLDNFRSSRPEMFENIWENCKENILGGAFF